MTDKVGSPPFLHRLPRFFVVLNHQRHRSVAQAGVHDHVGLMLEPLVLAHLLALLIRAWQALAEIGLRNMRTVGVTCAVHEALASFDSGAYGACPATPLPKNLREAALRTAKGLPHSLVRIWWGAVFNKFRS